jgi:UDP-2,4-diacetamido-2,4,6-trideoxy-beta-L-altropyranose hydrolase
MKISIITHGDKKLGLGHIIRCLSIYQAFETEGIKATIYAPYDESVSDIFKHINYISVDWMNDLENIVKLTDKSDISIIDSPIAQNNIYKLLARNAKIPVFFDDNQRINYPKGVVINRTIYGDKIKYPKNGSIYLLGARYLPLTKALWYVPGKKVRDKVEKFMVTFGGSDPKEMTPKILKFLTETYPDIKKVVLVGRAYGESSALHLFKDKNTKIYYHPSGEQLKNLMLDTDLAISAGGQTLYELARIGVPTIAIKVVSNQTKNINSLVSAGFIEYAGKSDDSRTFKNLASLIKKMGNRKVREKKGEIGRNLIDGYGSVRIANFLLGLNQSL